MSIVNVALSELKERAIKELTARAVQKAVLASSFFATPGINGVTIMIIEWIIRFVFDQGEILAFYGYTAYTVNKQEDGVRNAISKNDTSVEKKLDLINAARDFIKLRP